MAVSTIYWLVLSRYLVDAVGKLLSCLPRSLPTPSFGARGAGPAGVVQSVLQLSSPCAKR